MKCKRKREDEDEGKRRDRLQRRRKRCRSMPQLDTSSAEKREALKRLFGRICSVEAEDPRVTEEDLEAGNSDFGDENDDPLLDSVPGHMDPEQLGFLVCAQETLRFLHGRGVPKAHPVFTRLRLRLLRGIDEIWVA